MMHEWALAEAVIRAVEEIVREKSGRVIEVKVVLGELQQVEEDIFREAITMLSRNTILEDAKIVIDRGEARFKCRNCGFEWSFSSLKSNLGEEEAEAIHFIPEIIHVFVKCPKCGSPDYEVTSGRGVWIEYIKIEGEELD